MLVMPKGLTSEECDEIQKEIIAHGMNQEHFTALFLGLLRTATAIANNYGKDSENISIAYSAVMRGILKCPSHIPIRSYVCRSIHNALIESKRRPHVTLDINPTGRFYDFDYIDIKDTIKALSESQVEQKYLEMRLEGYTQTEISNILNIPKYSLSRMIAKIESRYVEKFGGDR